MLDPTLCSSGFLAERARLKNLILDLREYDSSRLIKSVPLCSAYEQRNINESL